MIYSNILAEANCRNIKVRFPNWQFNTSFVAISENKIETIYKFFPSSEYLIKFANNLSIEFELKDFSHEITDHYFIDFSDEIS